MFSVNTKRKNTRCIKWDRIKNVIPFSIADTDYKTANVITKAICKRAKTGAFGYTFIDEDYLMVIKNWIKKRYHYDVDTKMIVNSPGIVFALNMVIKAFSTNEDNILIQPPVYNMFKDTIDMNTRPILFNDLIKNGTTYSIDFEDLEEKLKRTKIFVFCNPHNPVGRVWSYEEVKQVVSLCKKYNVLLISDEIHCDLILFNNKFTSAGIFKDLYKNMIVCCAPSKTFNVAGLETSNIVFFDENIKNKYVDIQTSISMSGPNLFGQVACEAAYKYGEKWLTKQNKYLERNYLYIQKFFAKNNCDIEIANLEGTYLVWIDLDFLNISGDKICDTLLTYGILVNDGGRYGEKYNKFIRLNIACPKKQLKKGLERLLQFINDYK